MKILVTNDDGFGSAGQIALFNAARSFGEVVVVAPAGPHSMKGHAVTTSQRIGVQCVDHELFGRAYACDGTPADCVRLALRHLPGLAPDMVLSGINHGANAGLEVYYSGTVAAAREAVMLGRSGVAISQLHKPDWSDNWTRSTELAIQALHQGLSILRAVGDPALLNVNLPDLGSTSKLKGIRVCALASQPLAVEFSAGPGDLQFLSDYEVAFTGRYFDRICQAGSDFDLLMQGWMTITPLLVDATDVRALSRVPTAHPGRPIKS